jgi:hypothetical protein
MEKTIKLSDVVMVSDPCYKVPTWCQKKLTNVLNGEYKIFFYESQLAHWGKVNSYLGVVHSGFVNENLSWRILDEVIGVDSGQAGIFSYESYRNDDIVDSISMPESDFTLNSYGNIGDRWYEAMCKLTQTNENYGSYETGVLSTSGYGDGVYRCLVAKKNKLVVGICIDFGIENKPNKFINSLFK